MKRLGDLINESGAGLWGTDKARAKLQKDTPGQEIKSLVKDKNESADPKGTIKVVKQDKVRYITKDELNTYRQMGWKQADKRPQGDDKIRAAKKAHAAGTWDGNVNKDGKPIVHIDGKPVIVEDVKNPYTKYDSQKLQQLKKKMRDNVANLTQRVRMRNSLSGNASQSMKDELKDLERKSKLIDMALRDSAKQSDAKRAGVSSDRETFRDRQNRLGKTQTESVEQLDELKISFKFDKLADAAKAERKANQMKKLNVDSEKVQGKMMWLLHVTGNYTDIMKYIKRVDLEDKVHEGAFYGRDDLVKRFATPKKDKHKFIKLRKTDSSGTHGVSMKRDGNEDKIKDYLSKGYKEVPVESVNEGMLDTLKQRVQQAQDALKKFRDSETAERVRDQQRARIEKGKKVLDAPNLRKKFNRESIEESSESWEDGYKRRVVKTTKPEHKEKGYNWRIKGKDKAHLTIKLYKEKPSQAEFNKQMKRVAGHEFGG